MFGNRINLIHGDALTVSWPKSVKLVSNLPYSIGIRVLQDSIHKFVQSATVMLQEEVVDKLVSSPCDANYGSLTIFFQLYSNLKKCFSVLPNNFLPSPQVNSSILYLVPKPKTADFRNLELLARNIFFTKNRTVKRVIKGFIKHRANKSTIDLIPYGEKRVRCINLKELEVLLNFLKSHGLWPLAV